MEARPTPAWRRRLHPDEFEALRRTQRDPAVRDENPRALPGPGSPTGSAGASESFEDALLYRAILQSAADYAIIAADRQGRILEWNVGAHRLLGWPQDEIVGQDIRIIFTPEDRESGMPELEMRRSIEDGHALDRRWHLKRDGTRFWADGRMMPLLSDAGEIRGYLKILKDETGQKTTETVAETHRGVLRTITDHLDVAIIQVDAADRITFANPAVERLFGWSAADLHGRSLSDALPIVGDVLGADEGLVAAVRAKGDAIRDRETTMVHRNGTAVPVTCSTTPIIVAGAFSGAVVAIADITARKGAESRVAAQIRRHEALAVLQGAVDAAAGDFDGVLAAVAQGALAVLPQTRSASVQMTEGRASVVRASSEPVVVPVGSRTALDTSLVGASLAAARPVTSDDLLADGRAELAHLPALGFRSALAVPVAHHGALVGAVELLATEIAAFGPDDLMGAQVLAGHVATGLARQDEAAALRAMRESEERLHLALEASETIGTWDWDVENGLCYADPRFARLFSVDPAEAAAGLPIASFAGGIHPDDRIWVGMAARKAMAESGDYSIEHRVVLADGSTRWLAARGRSHDGPTGRARRFIGAVVDITERKRVETSLRTAETNARLAVRAAGLGLWDYDPVDDAMVWDDRCRHIFGLHPDQEPSLDTVMLALMPQSRERLRSIVQTALATSRLIDQAQDFEILRQSDGQHRWIEVSAQAFFAEGRCNRIIGTVGDITERKRLEAALREDEQRFRTMAESIPQLAWMASPSGDIFWFNERWFDYTGTTLDEVRGEGWHAVHSPDTRPAATDRLAAAFRDGTPWDDTLLLRGRDGTFRWFLSRALPIREESGRVQRWFGTHTDVDDQVRARDAQARFGEDLERQVEARTRELSAINERLVAEMAERQRAEEALRQAQKMEAVGQLTGGIAHDFNNLLTGITGSLDLMRKRIDQGRIADLDRYMSAAATSANRAAALTHRLLAFARRQPLDAKPLDANSLVASLEDLFHRTLGEAIDIDFVLAPDLWTTLCDPHQLENALLNLVINARDAMPDGGRLTIQTSNAVIATGASKAGHDRRAGDYVKVRVADTGVGMTADVMGRVFEPFFTTKPLGQGTGLGLSMIYGFARQSDGYVEIESQPGEGSAFGLLLPRFGGDPEGDAHAQPAALDSTVADGEVILVVEDDPVVLGLILDVLGDLGYTTLEARDGLAGLAILQGRARVDLLITDVGLPGLNGRHLAEMARASRPDLKVMFITGYAENAAFGPSVGDAATQMITKPFSVDALAVKIREIFRP